MRVRLLLLSPLVLLAALACDSDDDLKSTDIVTEIPWTAPETNTYRVLDDDGEEVGTVELSIEQDGDELTLRQDFDFPELEFTNEAEVVVDSQELQPRASTYQVAGPEGVASCEAEYEPRRVSVHNVREDGEHDETLTVPPVTYDSWSDLFLWRTIDFTPGYEVEYTDVVACQVPAPPARLPVKLEVREPEEVVVPAGSYDAFRVDAEAGADQKAWFTTDSTHTLVKYDNGTVTFELTESQQ